VDAPPQLTAIVVVGRLRARAIPCLRSLLDQSLAGRLEVVVVDVAADDHPPVPGCDDPRVRVLPAAPGTTFARARARGVAAARGEVVAFVEEHVRVRPGWAAAVVGAFRQGWAGVGAVPLAGSDEPPSELLGVLNYGEWGRPVARGEVALLPGHNATFRTDVLRSYGEELERLLACDLVLHGRLRRDGHRLAMEPDAEFEHLNEVSLGVLARGLFLWYRCYGPLRAAEEGWSLARRLGYVLATPLVPLYFLRTFRRRLRHQGGDVLRRLFWADLPAVLGVQLAGACGQALGLLSGVGDAEVRFSDYELHAPRLERRAAPPASS
jgi:GT2 family glycosyltransferase